MAIQWKYLLLVLTVLVFTSCNSGNADETNQKVDESVYDAKEIVEYGNATTYLDAYLYVNDQPITSGNDFIGIVKLYSIENTMPDGNISDLTLYLLQEDHILWHSEETNDVAEIISENCLEIIFRNGPSDLRFETVNVVLAFTFDGEKVQIMQKSLYIDSVQ
jgi:hypothetical protein